MLLALKDSQLVARPEAFSKVLRAEASLKYYLPLVEKVIIQSEARIFQADTHHPDKILSLFEPHSVVIQQGAPHPGQSQKTIYPFPQGNEAVKEVSSIGRCILPRSG